MKIKQKQSKIFFKNNTEQKKNINRKRKNIIKFRNI